jgi:hypothetical protein
MGFWPKSQKTPRLRPKNTPHNGQKCLAKKFFVAKKMAKNAKNRPHNQKIDPHKNAKNRPLWPVLVKFGQKFFDHFFIFWPKTLKIAPIKFLFLTAFVQFMG